MKLDVEKLLDVGVKAVTSKKGQKIICGTYSNGKRRSVIDALRDEYISPEDRARWDEIKKKKKKKHKKKDDKKKKKKKKKSTTIRFY